MEPVRKRRGRSLAAAATSGAPAAEVGRLPLFAMAGVVEAEERRDPRDWAKLFPDLVGRLHLLAMAGVVEAEEERSAARGWADLFPDLVCRVADDLLRSDVTEYIRLRAVCKPWRRATADDDPRLTESRFFPRNWQLLRGNMLGEKPSFVNVQTGASLKVQIPPQYGRVVACADGCLVLEDNTTYTMSLLNPMIMAAVDLPYLNLLPIIVDVTGAGIVNDGGGEAFTVVVCFTVWDLASICCAKPGDIRWRLVDMGIEEGGVPMLEGGLTVGGNFYVPKRTGDVLKVVLHPQPRLAHVARLQQDGPHMVGGFTGVRIYLVPSLDDTDDEKMLLVRGLYEHHQGALMDVFQVNIGNGSIAELHDIGDRTIFLPRLTLRAVKFPELHQMIGVLSHDNVEMHIHRLAIA